MLESKREFASRYGLKAEYWRHFKAEEAPEVLTYVKANLKDLATHYHGQYQNGMKAAAKNDEKNDEKLADYREARQRIIAPPSIPRSASSTPIRGRTLPYTASETFTLYAVEFKSSHSLHDIVFLYLTFHHSVGT